jgi:Ca2+-binding EF-hand superfamily protein
MPLGPMAEEYIAQYAPTSRKKGYFKMPIRPPTHMQPYEEDVLAEVMKEMIEILKDVESRKNQLALRPDFSIHDFFAIFDSESRGAIDFREFREVYDLFKIYSSHHSLRLAFIALDKDLD